jgi:hypothetical protein
MAQCQQAGQQPGLSASQPGASKFVRKHRQSAVHKGQISN